jgi:hypothetical protein
MGHSVGIRLAADRSLSSAAQALIPSLRLVADNLKGRSSKDVVS